MRLSSIALAPCVASAIMSLGCVSGDCLDDEIKISSVDGDDLLTAPQQGTWGLDDGTVEFTTSTCAKDGNPHANPLSHLDRFGVSVQGDELTLVIPNDDPAKAVVKCVLSGQDFICDERSTTSEWGPRTTLIDKERLTGTFTSEGEVDMKFAQIHTCEGDCAELLAARSQQDLLCDQVLEVSAHFINGTKVEPPLDLCKGGIKNLAVDTSSGVPVVTWDGRMIDDIMIVGTTSANPWIPCDAGHLSGPLYQYATCGGNTAEWTSPRTKYNLIASPFTWGDVPAAVDPTIGGVDQAYDPAQGYCLSVVFYASDTVACSARVAFGRPM